jgi:tetratricopeptide (TPR) repeat protein
MELAVCLARLHRYKEAAVTLDPVAPPMDSPQLLLYRRLKASIASGNKDDAAAADEMAKALELARGDRGLAFATAVAQFRAGRLDQALASAEKSKGIQDSADIENLIGDIQERRGDSLAAVHGYQTAVALAPDNEEYRLSLALELLRHHTFEPAILVLEQGSKQFPASLRMRVALGLGYFLVNRDSDATATLLGAMRLESGRAFVLDYLGDLLIDQGDTPDTGVVKEVCADADAHPDSAMAQAVCGGLLLRAQADQADATHYDEPLARLRKAVQLAGDNATARCQLGKAFELNQQWKDARQQMEECVRLRPDSTEWHYRLSRIYVRLGLGDLAKEQDRLRAEADQKLAAQSQQRYATLARFLYALGSKSEP